jgi:hypothetical protein
MDVVPALLPPAYRSQPGIDETQAFDAEMHNVARCQRGAVAERYCGDHAIGNEKYLAPARGVAHDPAINDRRLFIESVYPSCKMQPRFPEKPFEGLCPLIRPDAFDAELYLGKDDGRQSQFESRLP